ncbi:MAG: hypothetical protein IPM07_27755 [Anaerolineales bacterium]|nr:hypothetical protein [Anaerolineales bacterium]
MTKKELVENLRSLLHDIRSDQIPFVREVEGTGCIDMKRRDLLKRLEALGFHACCGTEKRMIGP